MTLLTIFLWICTAIGIIWFPLFTLGAVLMYFGHPALGILAWLILLIKSVNK